MAQPQSHSSSNQHIPIGPLVQSRFVRSYAPYAFNVVFIIIFVMFALRPTILTISTLQKQIQENQKLLEDIRNKSKSIEQGKQNLDKISQEDKDKIRNAIPSHPNVPLLVTSIQNSITSESSISALQVQPIILFEIPEASNSGTPEKVEFSFNFHGTYAQGMETIQNVLKSPRIITIDSLVINKSEEEPLLLTITGTATYLK